MSDKEKWTPRYVYTDGEDGKDCADLFESGITGKKYLEWLKTNLRKGRPVIHPKKKLQAKPKPKAKPRPKPEPAPVVPDNVVALRNFMVS